MHMHLHMCTCTHTQMHVHMNAHTCAVYPCMIYFAMSAGIGVLGLHPACLSMSQVLNTLKLELTE